MFKAQRSTGIWGKCGDTRLSIITPQFYGRMNLSEETNQEEEAMRAIMMGLCAVMLSGCLDEIDLRAVDASALGGHYKQVFGMSMDYWNERAGIGFYFDDQGGTRVVFGGLGEEVTAITERKGEFIEVPVYGKSAPGKGKITFNADIEWEIWPDNCFARTGAHELGHILGLGEVDKPGNIMHHTADWWTCGEWGEELL